MGGETRINLNVQRVLSDIGYIRDLKQSAIFDYVPTSSLKLSLGEVHQVITILQQKGELGVLGIRKEPNSLSSMVADLDANLSSDIMTVVYSLDTSKTALPEATNEAANKYTLNIVLKDTQLRMSINNSERVTIAKFQEDSEPHKILRAIFDEPYYQIKVLYILNSKKNLKNILQRNNLIFLIEYGLIEADKDSVRLASPEIKLNKSDAQEFISKFIEKYRNGSLALLR